MYRNNYVPTTRHQVDIVVTTIALAALTDHRRKVELKFRHFDVGGRYRGRGFIIILQQQRIFDLPSAVKAIGENKLHPTECIISSSPRSMTVWKGAIYNKCNILCQPKGRDVFLTRFRLKPAILVFYLTVAIEEACSDVRP